MAFGVLSKMAQAWGGAANASIPGFNEFMFSRFSPLCWALPSTPGFNAKDAQSRQVLGEAGALQHTIYSKAGAEYVAYLRTRELPGMGMGPELVGEYIDALSRSDARGFRAFFQVGLNTFVF